MQDTFTNLQTLRSNWTIPNQNVQSGLDDLVYLLKEAVAKEPSADRVVWLKKSLKEAKSAQTAMMRCNSALNASEFHAA